MNKQLLLKSLLLATTLGVSTMVQAVPNIAPGTQLAKEQEYRTDLSKAVQSLNYIYILESEESEKVKQQILNSLFETLVVYDTATQSYVPGVAKSWKVSEDGKTYTFYLRDDAKWSNGDKVTADDFYRSIFRLLSSFSGQSYSYKLMDLNLENMKEVYYQNLPLESLGVKIINDKTLEFNLTQPTPWLLQVLSSTSFIPVHKSTENKTWDLGNTTLITNGAFTLKEFSSKKIKLEKNTKYWNKSKVIINKAEFNTMADTTQSLARFTKNVINAYDLPNIQFSSVNSKLGNLVQAQDNRKFGLQFYDYLNNKLNSKFANKNVRKALSLLIDFNKLQADILKEQAVIIDSTVDRNTIDGQYLTTIEERKLLQKTRNTQAQELLKKAGFSTKKPLTINWTDVDVLNDIEKLSAKSDLVVMSDLVLFLKEQFNKNSNGLVKVNTGSFKNNTDYSIFDMSFYIGGWDANFNSGVSYLAEWIDTEGRDTTFADQFYKLPNLNMEERAKSISKLDKFLTQDGLYVIPLFSFVSNTLYNSNLKGVSTNLELTPLQDLYFVK